MASGDTVSRKLAIRTMKMNQLSEVGFQVPKHIRAYLRDLGYMLPLCPMDDWIRV